MNKDQSNYNAHTVVSIHVVDKKENLELTWYPERKKSFWKKHIPEGFESIWGTKRYTKKELEEAVYHETSFIVENTTVYYRPYIKIVFVNNEKVIIDCKDIERTKELAEQISNQFELHQMEHNSTFFNIKEYVDRTASKRSKNQ
jgi:hypothetical protein